MANTNSNLITNAEAVPPVQNNVALMGGRVRIAMDQFDLAAADFDADGDTVKLCRLPSNARIISLKFGNDDLDTGTTVAFNFGVYTTAGAIVDEDCIASAVTAQAAAALTELRFEAAGIDTMNKPLWELAGQSADPGGLLDVVATSTAANAGAAAGTVAFQILYTVD